MNMNPGGGNYVPGTYARKRPSSAELVGHYVRGWERRKMAQQKAADAAAIELAPCIAFSRKIGVGALEIADLVARQLDYKVADRELVEKIASQANTSKTAISFFDERFPGYASRTFKYLFGEKSFIDSDYSRHLFSAINAIAALEPTIFVGRGAHLVLPRERVLAVRFICSDAFRVGRIADIMKIDKSEAKKQLSAIDKEQAAFFKKVFGKKAADANEFDMVINMDHFTVPAHVADLVALAFNKKFKSGA